MKNTIIRHDRVMATSGHFEGTRGYVTRTTPRQACVVWRGVWGHGIWVDISDLKRTKRYTKEQGLTQGDCPMTYVAVKTSLTKSELFEFSTRKLANKFIKELIELIPETEYTLSKEYP